ncbi:MAG: DUF2092 domain-containing protein [Firmicutes bacterium]|nr:DUF2092 domain-containing protein [Bacillota bacterium]
MKNHLARFLIVILLVFPCFRLTAVLAQEAQSKSPPPPVETPQKEMTPQEILNKVFANYKNASSFQETSIQTIVADTSKGRQKYKVKTRFFYQAPDKFYYEAYKDGEKFTLSVSNGKKVIECNFLLREYRTYNSSPKLEQTILKSTYAKTEFDPLSFIRGTDPAKNMKEIKLLKTEKIDGKTCYCIKLTGILRTVKLWLDAEKYFLLKAVGEVKDKDFDGSYIYAEVNEKHQNIKIDEVLPSNIFNYKPPANFTKVNQFSDSN